VDSKLGGGTRFTIELPVNGGSGAEPPHIGENPAILKVFDQIKKVAPTDSTVLIYGESGTGKELFARATHAHSRRAAHQFVALDCSTLAPGVLERELFGHVRGAFSGAVKDKPGIFEVASAGTLFLDEISGLSPEIQGKLLRVMESGEFKRVGATAVQKTNARIIAASNRDLDRMVAEGLFRRDLFYRLNVFSIRLPALRDHLGDLPLLAAHFLAELGESREVHESFEDFARQYAWPGNVRELKNTLEYMVRMTPGPLHVRHLPGNLKGLHLEGDSPRDRVLEIIARRSALGLGTGRRSIMEDFSRSYYPVSEGKIREYIEDLQARGKIRVFKGRKGCRLVE